MTDETKFETYLGDAVYAGFDGNYVVLKTSNGMSTTNKIYLEPEVMNALVRYHEFINEEIKKKRDESE